MLNERLVQGELAALKTICMALIATHPQKQALLAVLERMKEQTLANSLPTLAHDDALQAAEQTLEQAMKPLRGLA